MDDGLRELGLAEAGEGPLAPPLSPSAGGLGSEGRRGRALALLGIGGLLLGLACLVASTALILTPWSEGVLILADAAYPAWVPGALLLVPTLIGFALAITAAALRHRRPGSSPHPAASIATASVGILLAVLMGIVATGAILRTVHEFQLNTRYTVLQPASPDGCRIVVRTSSFLLAGGGVVYPVSAGSLFGFWTESYSVDDGTHPQDALGYRLSWSDEVATIDGGTAMIGPPITVRC